MLDENILIESDVPSILVVMATLNEETGVGPTLEDINDVLGNPSVLIVDGKSDDRTVEIAKNLGANVVFQKQTGKEKQLAKE